MSKRIRSIDAMRAVAMFFIVVIHANPFEGVGLYGSAIHFVLNSLARFAVPFFFLTSGYLFADKLKSDSGEIYYRKFTKRIASIYVFGFSIAFPVHIIGSSVKAMATNQGIKTAIISEVQAAFSPIKFLIYGNSISEPLWFLPSLIYSITFIYFFDRKIDRKLIFPIALLIHFIGILDRSYHVIDLPVNLGGGILVGFFYTALGYLLYRINWSPDQNRTSWYFIAVVGFGVVHIIERYIMGYVVREATLVENGYGTAFFISTIPFSLAIFLLILANPNWGTNTSLPTIGKYSVGIYVIHPQVLYFFYGISSLLSIQLPLHDVLVIFWNILVTPLVFVLSLLLYILLGKIGLINPSGNHVPQVRQTWSYVAGKIASRKT